MTAARSGRALRSEIVVSDSTVRARPPQQARSRAALQRLLASAEHVLINDGLEEFTIARVAEHAGVSVGGVYRRFDSKEQLIEAVRRELQSRFEDAVSRALATPRTSLAAVVQSFSAALGEILADNGRIIPVMLAGGHKADAPQEGLPILTRMHQQFSDAVLAHREEIHHPRPDDALSMAFRGVIANGVHRAATAPWWPDGLSWKQWAREIADMTTLYLTAPRETRPSC